MKTATATRMPAKFAVRRNTYVKFLTLVIPALAVRNWLTSPIKTLTRAAAKEVERYIKHVSMFGAPLKNYSYSLEY